jgi:putative heme transporter
VTEHIARWPVPDRPARALAVALAAGAAAIGLYVLLPRLAGLDETWRRLGEGDPRWLAAALAFEVLSYASYVVLFRAVLARGNNRISLRASYQISMAGVAATRLFAAGGAGGIALTAWALRRSGQPPRRVAASLTAFLVLLYAVFMLALIAGGAGLRLGVLPGAAPFGLTVVPAAFGGAVIALALALTLVPPELDGRVVRGGRAARLVATVPVTIGTGVRAAIALARTGDPRLMSAVGWWAFDIAVLWACLHAFGSPPTIAVVVMAYFVGTLGNLIPLPGGVGGVEAGMIGALIGFGVTGGLAIVAVLAYRAFAFWLPLIPGTVAYLQLVQRVHRWRRLDG